ncbi:hypothetical protein BU23DRAFT_601115 [Bimuria novae-zelandiae CBS 107.79]|uniref:HTH CENPB-type domain-containing protein n=1 Tax=Bimuria novae-zelandiae CBS 107.79 TaxID=1447943 RepID=A0A6A5VA75_9PLEO|nr:hypothetical protein BU23DRAFT_601115 [Bimuria novae-zelandiae CBS 107.79]
MVRPAVGWRYTPPTAQEVMRKFDWKQYNQSCLSLWWLQRDKIIYEQPARSRKHVVAKRECWPVLEAALYQRFCIARQEGRRITMVWFKRQTDELYMLIYESRCSQFGYSVGWFIAFRRRYFITWRAITKQAQQVPKDLKPKAESFVRFIRWQNNLIRDGLYTGLSRFPYMAILNLDETPVPYEYADGHTYHHQGAKTVQYKITRSGWQNRQATVVLIVLADGQPLQAIVVFHGVPGGRIHTHERESWRDINVQVYINAKA